MQVRQGWRKPGTAVLLAHPVVGDEPVAVILPDVILDEYESDLSQDNLAEMIRRFDETGHSARSWMEPVVDVTAYGVVDCKGVGLAPGKAYRWLAWLKTKSGMLRRLISLLWVVTYLARIFGRCWQNPPGAGDEIQLTGRN